MLITIPGCIDSKQGEDRNNFQRTVEKPHCEPFTSIVSLEEDGGCQRYLFLRL
jgi:hypothetical protein